MGKKLKNDVGCGMYYGANLSLSMCVCVSSLRNSITVLQDDEVWVDYVHLSHGGAQVYFYTVFTVHT